MFRNMFFLLIATLLIAGCSTEDPNKNPMKVNVSVSGPVYVTLGDAGESEFVFTAQYNYGSKAPAAAGDTTPTGPSGITPFYNFRSYTIQYNNVLPPFIGGASIYGEPGKDVTVKVLVFPSSFSEYITTLPFSTGGYITFTGSDHEGRPLETKGHFTINIVKPPEESTGGTTT